MFLPISLENLCEVFASWNVHVVTRVTYFILRSYEWSVQGSGLYVARTILLTFELGYLISEYLIFIYVGDERTVGASLLER